MKGISFVHCILLYQSILKPYQIVVLDIIKYLLEDTFYVKLNVKLLRQT